MFKYTFQGFFKLQKQQTDNMMPKQPVLLFTYKTTVQFALLTLLGLMVHVPECSALNSETYIIKGKQFFKNRKSNTKDKYSTKHCMERDGV